jgi:vacuolar protein sorting-associated protein 51
MAMIDDPGFSPSLAFAQMIASHSLEELLQLQTNLGSEIKSLDSNMQTLVYENYNKFISATDMIRSMKTNVESMEEEMKRLESSMLKVQDLSSQVSQRLAPKQKQIRELIGVYDELQKIKSICDLPTVLRTALEKNRNKLHLDFEAAASSYNDSISFLIQHKNDASYSSIYQETFECVDYIKKMIWSKIHDLSLSPEAFTKYCKELKQFGEDSEKLPVVFCS